MINRVELSGVLVKDPESHQMRSGALRVDFTVAVKGVRWDRAAGCDVIEQVFIACNAWENVAEQAVPLCMGTVVHVTGQLTQEEIEKDGKKDRKTKVRVLVLSTVRTPNGSSY